MNDGFTITHYPLSFRVRDGQQPRNRGEGTQNLPLGTYIAYSLGHRDSP